MSTAIRKSIDKELLKNLSQQSLLIWGRDLLMDWGVMITSLYLVFMFPNVLTIFLCILVLGNRQHALAILGHDATHYRACKNRKLNDFLANMLCFWPLGLTISGYRKLHNKHHQTSGTHEDPELAHKRSRSPQWDLPASPYKILKYAALDLIGLSFDDYKIIVTYSKPDSKKQYIPLMIWHTTFISVSVLSGFWWIAVLWYLCLTTSFMMFFRLRLWLEHQGTSETHRLHLNNIEAAILAPHNSCLHWEHHNWPSIPYHNLKKLRKEIDLVPVMNLSDLIDFFGNAPQIKSGEVLKTSK